jgi:hypothetical protein
MEHIKRPKTINEGMQDVLMGTASLLGLKLTGYNAVVAKDALKSPKTLNLIKKHLESGNLDNLADSLEELGLLNAKNRIESDAFEIQKRFDDIAFNTAGVEGGLVIKLDD